AGGDVRPALPAVAAHVDDAVVGPGPEDAGLLRRFRDGEDDARVLDADVVAGQAPRPLLPRLVVEREVGADHLPRVAAVGGHVHVLAADVDLVVVVGRDRHREGPDEAVLDVGRGPARRGLGPDLDVAGGVRAQVVARDDAAHAAEARGARPDDVRILRVRRGPAALNPRPRAPHDAGD